MTRLIVALDNISYAQAKDKGLLSLLSEARDADMIWGIKITDMLYSGDIVKIVSSLREEFKLGVMADAKLHDIPSTMENTINKLVGAGADIVSIHCSSNFRPENKGILHYLAGVTALTSFTDLEIRWIYDKTHEDIVREFSDIAMMNKYEYIIGSVRDMTFVQDSPIKKICTGIRPSWYQNRHDQVRIASLKDAVRIDADYVVVGRPITMSDDIMAAIKRVYNEIQ
jgi:orotidine-5'-phosphate decarboxylase